MEIHTNGNGKNNNEDKPTGKTFEIKPYEGITTISPESIPPLSERINLLSDLSGDLLSNPDQYPIQKIQRVINGAKRLYLELERLETEGKTQNILPSEKSLMAEMFYKGWESAAEKVDDFAVDEETLRTVLRARALMYKQQMDINKSVEGSPTETEEEEIIHLEIGADTKKVWQDAENLAIANLPEIRNHYLEGEKPNIAEKIGNIIDSQANTPTVN